jgi:hypothetical protein
MTNGALVHRVYKIALVVGLSASFAGPRTPIHPVRK